MSAGPTPIYLGRYYDAQSEKVARDLSYDGERHLLLFGPNGSGKGTRLLVPNLLQLEGRSIVVIDPKGELTAITADWRRKVSDVVILNPFDLLGIKGVSFNPLAALSPDSKTFLDDASAIGEALIKIEGNDPHWPESAQGLIVALVMWEVQQAQTQRRLPELGNVRLMLTEPDEFEDLPNGGEKQTGGLRAIAAEMCGRGGIEIASLAARYARRTNDEVLSVQATADTQTRWLLSPPIREHLVANDLDFSQLKKRPTTVYLILPAERMRTHSVWLRLVIVSALRALYTPGGLPTLFMLDEFAQLGHLGPIEDAFGLVRGYGVQLWPVLQDLNQLQALYEKRWETFVGNAGVVQGFAPNDLTTAEWMSRRAGETTIAAASYNEGDAHNSSGASTSSGMSYSQARRRLFLPQELMEFREGTGLLWPTGTSKSVPFAAPSYYRERKFISRAKPNPYRL